MGACARDPRPPDGGCGPPWVSSCCWPPCSGPCGSPHRRRRRPAIGPRRSRRTRSAPSPGPAEPRLSLWSSSPSQGSSPWSRGPWAGDRRSGPSRSRCAPRAAADRPAPPRSDPEAAARGRTSPRRSHAHPFQARRARFGGRPSPPHARARRRRAGAARHRAALRAARGRRRRRRRRHPPLRSARPLHPRCAGSHHGVGHAHRRAGPHARRDPRRRLVQARRRRGDGGRHRRPADRLGHGARGRARPSVTRSPSWRSAAAPA